MKKKDYLYNAYKVVKNQPACNLPQCNWDYLEITYKAGKGHFKVLFYNLVCVFPITDYKKVISLLTEDNEGFDKANELHKIFVQMSEKLLDLKSKTNKTDEKSELQDALNRLSKLNDVLVDLFGIDSLQVEKTIKLKSDICHKLIFENGKRAILTDYKAKSFVKFGYKWFISSDSKIKGRKHIIIGSCGQSCLDFDGNIKQAIELVNEELLNKILLALDKIDNTEFLELLKLNNIERIPEFKINDSVDLVNDVLTEKENVTIEEFCKQFSFDYNLLYESEEINKSLNYSDKVNIFDRCLHSFKDILTEYVKYEGDFISSDRESAAFIMAIEFFIKTNKKTIAGYQIPAIA